MDHWVWIFPFGVASVIWSPTAGADETPTVQGIVAKYIEALGGQENLGRVKSVSTTGTQARGAMRGTFVFVYEIPNKMRREQTYPEGKGIGGFDGETGWYSIRRGEQTRSDEQTGFDRVLAEYEADFFGPLVDFQKKENRLKLVGRETVDGVECYKIEITRRDGDVHYFFLNAESFLPLKVTGRFQCQEVDVKYQTLFSDYRDVDGLLVAHSQVSDGTMGKSELRIERVRFNVDTTRQMFSKPSTSE